MISLVGKKRSTTFVGQSGLARHLCVSMSTEAPAAAATATATASPAKGRRSKKAKEEPIKKSLKNVVFGKVDVTKEQKIALVHSIERKYASQKAQTLMDFAFVLRPYMREYFSSIDSVLHSTPNFLEEKDIVAAFLGYRKKHDYNRPYNVTKVVEENLKANRPAYALHACRLGKENATVGMNLLLSYLSHREKFTTIFKVYNNLKKWGVTPNERTYAILSHSGSAFDSKMYKNDTKKLLKVYDDVMEKTKSTKSKIIYTNSTLVSLAKTSFPRNAYDFYMDIPARGAFSRDTITYSTMLNLIYRLKKPSDFPEILALRDTIWNEALSRVNDGELKMSDKLVNSYCNCLSLLESPEAYQRIISLFDHYFNINESTPGQQTKYPFTEVQLDTILKSALHTGNSTTVLKYYHMLDDIDTIKIDRSCFHNFLRNFALIEDFNISIAGELLSKVMKQNKSPEDSFVNSLSIHLLWRIFVNSEAPIDVKKIDEMKDTLIPLLDIPVDDLIISGYLACYIKALGRNNTASPQQALEAAKFVSENLGAISNVSITQKNPLRINKCLTNMSILCRRVLNQEENFDLLRSGQLDWLKSTLEKCKSLNKELEKNFADNKSFKRKSNITEAEFKLFHQKQKEILARFRKLIEYHEVHIAKPQMKGIKTTLKAHTARRLEDPPVPIKDFEKLEI